MPIYPFTNGKEVIYMNKQAFSIKTFSPAWFAMIMGIGAVTNATYLLGFSMVGKVLYFCIL
jgi:tellurite resistance protein TehA-like permease